MIKIQKLIDNQVEIFNKFNRKRTIKKEKSEEIYASLNDIERKKYGQDQFGLFAFIHSFFLGNRRYLLRQEDKDIPKAMKTMKK